MIAGAAVSLSSVSVISNSLRLRKQNCNGAAIFKMEVLKTAPPSPVIVTRREIERKISSVAE